MDLKMKNQKQSLFTTILIINNKPKILNCFRCISKCLLYFYIFHACMNHIIQTDATSNVLKFFVDANWHKEVSRMWLRLNHRTVLPVDPIHGQFDVYIEKKYLVTKNYRAFLNFSMDNILSKEVSRMWLRLNHHPLDISHSKMKIQY
ncbi:hypothetical protein ACJX0J_007542 [Zea mays]